MRPISSLTVALMLQIPVSNAQTPAPRPPAEFEVASIKPNKTNERMYYGLRNGDLTVRNMTVKSLILIAYGKKDFQVVGGPDWMAAETFDIDAKAERPLKATHDMEKLLLASRFHLQLHKETREAMVYSMTVARGGLKMKLSADQTDPEKGGPRELAPGRIAGDGIPMYVIVNLLSNMLGRAVINNTGLAGKFDVNLQLAAGALVLQADSADSQAQAEDLKLAVIDAIEKQLGLRIESVKARDEVLVIDHIDRVSEN